MLHELRLVPTTMTSPQRHTLDEKRHYPRIHIDSVVELSRGTRSSLRTKAHDISLNGLQIRCDKQTAIHLASLPGDPRREIEQFDARLKLLVRGGETVEILASCRRCYATRRNRDEIAVGFQFSAFHGQGEDRLQRFIERALEPA